MAGESMPVPGGEPLTSGPPVAHMVLSSPLTETPSQSPHWPPTPPPLLPEEHPTCRSTARQPSGPPSTSSDHWSCLFTASPTSPEGGDPV